MSKKDSRSKFLALVLRHKPESIGIILDNNGWADVEELLKNISKEDKFFNFEVLKDIVDSDSKGRYSFNEDNTKIRANQGHSIKVDVELKEVLPPDTLYHGTATRFMDSINRQGLRKGNRLYVHLSDDLQTAVKVGKRHGEPIVLNIDTSNMVKDGFKFYLSKNGVWLVESVPSKYIHVMRV